MTEGPPQTETAGAAAEKRKNREIIEYAALLLELIKSQERFPFPGIDAEAYAKLKTEEAEFPGYATPIDTLVARFRAEGMKVAFGKNPASGDIFVLPSGSDDIEHDSIFPRHLLLEGIMDGRLKVLVRMSKTRRW